MSSVPASDLFLHPQIAAPSADELAGTDSSAIRRYSEASALSTDA